MTKVCFRPLARIGWGPTWVFDCKGIEIEEVFPAPLEVWVVSYRVNTSFKDLYYVFPSPLEVWVESYS